MNPQEQLTTQGYTILETCLQYDLIRNVLKTIHRDLFKDGISAREIYWFKKEACWFPALRDHADINALRESLPEWAKEGVPCEPQILISPPTDAVGEPWSHIDQEPPWANGRTYKAIVGVPLTPFNEETGGVVFWPFDLDGARVTPKLEAGEAFVMHPKLPHSGGFNLSGLPRYAVYFRFLNK